MRDLDSKRDLIELSKEALELLRKEQADTERVTPMQSVDIDTVGKRIDISA